MARRRLRAPRAASAPPLGDLLVAGHINVDRYLDVARFPDADRTVPVLATTERLGGTAANLARVAGSLGLRTALLSSVGHDFPPEFRSLLEGERIDLHGVATAQDRPTPTCTIVRDRRHGQRTLIEQGPLSGEGGRLRVPAALLARYRWVHLCTGPPPWIARIAEEARRAGSKVGLDPAQEIHYRWSGSLLDRALARSEILFGNRAELARAIELLGASELRTLLARVPLIVRTEGPRGATAFSRAGAVHAPAFPPRRVRTLVGAGDAFRGGFYAGWLAGLPLPACLTAGTRAAAHWIEQRPLRPARGRR